MYQCFLLPGASLESVMDVVSVNGRHQRRSLQTAPTFPVNGRSSEFEVVTADADSTDSPSAAPTLRPSDHPSGSPSSTPTNGPTSASSSTPSLAPTAAPIDDDGQPTSTGPTNAPSDSPSLVPTTTGSPTAGPTPQRSGVPSAVVSQEPSDFPTSDPTDAPSVGPSNGPSAAPTTASPSDAPSLQPSTVSSASLSREPSALPTAGPMASPSSGPSDDPSAGPTVTSSPTLSTYVPGDLTVYENDLKLSTGLRSRIVATVGRAVELEVPKSDGSMRSSKKFHADPDGGAIIEHPSGDGRYTYVSNVEEKDGGVGAIYFDASGKITDYDMILEDETSYNCGGGLSPWPSKTWLTCEEHSRGQVWEVDPWTKTYQETKMGRLPSSGEIYLLLFLPPHPSP